MHNLEKANEIYKRKLKEDPEYAIKLIAEWRDEMPEEYIKKMFEEEYGCHIAYNTEMYEEAVSLLKWAGNKGEGEKWSVEDVEKVSGIDFDDKEYYPLDFAYVMNMLYSDYCDIFTETSYYVKMARNYLEDSDYPGEADERAYKNAKKRIASRG